MPKMFTGGKSQTGVSIPALDPGENQQIQQINTIINEDLDNRPFARISINDQKYNGLLDDSGANRTAMGLNVYEKLKKFNLEEEPANSKVRTANGVLIDVQSCLIVPVQFKNIIKIIPMLVIPGLSRDLILGMDIIFENLSQTVFKKFDERGQRSLVT